VISCAGPTRHEHGTQRTQRAAGKLYGTSPDYYRNLSQQDIVSALKANTNFHKFGTSGRGTEDTAEDTYFWGFKNG
jgi:hypothetical protein